jgi:hypothetical protein
MQILIMKYFSKQAFLFLLFLLFSVEAQATINLGVLVEGKKLSVYYAPKSNHFGSPGAIWDSQVVTVRYPTNVAVVWSDFQNLTSLPFSEDPLTAMPVDGGDGYFYKVFQANGVNVFRQMIIGENFPVFSMGLAANADVTFEIIASSPWTVANNANASVVTPFLNEGDIFGEVEELGNRTYDGTRPFGLISIDGPINVSPIRFLLTFNEPITGLTASDFYIYNGTVQVDTTVAPYELVVTPGSPGSLTIGLAEGRVADLNENLNVTSRFISINYSPAPAPACLATYHLQELNDGYYQVSLIAGQNWSGTDAITATAQVTIKAGTSTSVIDSFNITDLQMLVPGVSWAQNSRYNAPVEAPGSDYISFGLVSYGTNAIPYVAGDTVPLFKWKNTGICSEDSVYLMAISGDAFAYPNSLNANVGQQLSVSGYNEPDVPLCVEGVASCIAEVVFDFRALLQGPYVSAEGLMHDSLRVLDLIPATEPYTNYQPIRGSSFSPFQHYEDGGGETVDFSAPFIDTVPAVDWVLIELRSQYDPKVIISTRSAMVLRNGVIRDLNYGNFLLFKKLRSDKYFFTVRHRNHLALMSEGAVPLVNTVNTYDFSDPTNPMFDLNPDLPQFDLNFKSSPDGINAGYLLGDKRLMWAGNSNADDYIMFQGGGIGEGLDIDNVFDNIFSDPNNLNFSYNHVRDGYYPGDNNLDGRVKYQGPANDVDQYIFFNIISRHPGNVQKYINYYITQQLPK